MAHDQSPIKPRRRPQTEMVRGGLARSGFDETSEALFLTSGYIYPSAEDAEAAFKGDLKRYHLFALRQPDGGHVRGTPAPDRGRRGLLRHRQRHGRGVRRDRCVRSRPATGWSPRGRCSGPANTSSRSCCRATASRSNSSTAPMPPPGGRRSPHRRFASFIETPSNPTLEIIDIAAVAELAHAAGARLIVDNVFATPVLQRPLEFGADVVVYSATKHIDGQGRTLGGAVLGSQSYSSTTICGTFCATPGPRSARSTPGSWSRAWRPWTCGSSVIATTRFKLARYLEGLIGGALGITRVFYPGLESHPQFTPWRNGR